MTQENEHLGTGFEQKIIQAMICDHAFAEQLLDVIEPELFDMPVTKELAKILKSYYFKYRTLPTVELIFTIVGADAPNVVVKGECVTFLKRIQEHPLNGDMEYVKEKSLLFFRTQHVKNVLANDVLPKIKNHNLDEIAPLIQNALAKGTDRNIGFEYDDKNIEKIFDEHEEKKIPTPWKCLNDLFDGGWGEKRLATFMGPSGAGKSFALINCGAGALDAGKTVIYYALELDELEVAKRFTALFTGIDINDLKGNKNKVLSILKTKLPASAKLIIKEYPMKCASVQTIKAHLSKMALKDILPDVIIIDYGDLLKPMEIPKEKRHGIESIWQDMKALAQEMKLPVITATQTNRSGYESEVITADQISEDFSKVMTSDILITMARNAEQKFLGVGKMLLAKSRQSEDGIVFDYTINTAKAKIEMFNQTNQLETTTLKSPTSILDDYLEKQKKVH